MKVVVVGAGYVGLVTGVCLAEKNHKVICLDNNTSKIEMLKKDKSPIYDLGIEKLLKKHHKSKKLNYTSDYKKIRNASVIIVTVDTPENLDGSANLDSLYKSIEQISENVNKDCIIMIKSTVPVGTSDAIEIFLKEHLKNKVNIDVVSNPEFLSQGSALKDAMKSSRIIIGIENEKVKDIIEELYKDFNSPIIYMNRRSSEMVKYASNNFIALKISYINEIANLCEIIGADIDNVTKGMSYDARIGDSFLKYGCGYGGSCLPKDTKALYNFASKYGYKLKTVEATISVNNTQQTILFSKAKKKFNSLKGKNIAVLGLTFKPQTDDLRNATSLENIKLLLKEGANIKVYDPKALEKIKKIYSLEIEYANTPQEALKNADICFIFTEWNEIKKIKPTEFASLMKSPIVYDGRNIYDLNEMKDSGVDYYSIGRTYKDICNKIKHKNS